MANKLTLAMNDIASARARGAPIYEVVGKQVTLDMSPYIHVIKPAVIDSLTCKVYQHNPNGTKHVIHAKTNGKVTLAYNALGESA